MGFSSVKAGVYGALAGVLGKYAFSDETIVTRSVFDSCRSSSSVIFSEANCQYFVYVARFVMFLLMLWDNALMFSSAFKGLNEDGSLTSTVLSTSANFLCTAFLGYFLFNEQLPYSWCVGASMVALGIYFVLLGKDKNEDEKAKKE